MICAAPWKPLKDGTPRWIVLDRPGSSGIVADRLPSTLRRQDLLFVAPKEAPPWIPLSTWKRFQNLDYCP